MNSDGMVNFGGGFFNEDYKKAFLSELIFLWLCEKLNKPVALLAQSLGPFYSEITRRLAIRGLNRCDILTIRENDSYRICQSLGLTKPRVAMTADCALLLPPLSKDEVNEYAHKIGLSADGYAIGFSVRRWKYPGTHNPNAKHQEYVQAIAEVASELAKKTNAHIILVPSSTRPNDHAVCLEVSDKINNGVCVHIAGHGTNLAIVRKAIACCNLFVGTRLHPLIFATQAHVPSLAISYTPKVAGYMQTIERSNLVFPMDDISTKRLLDVCMSVWRRRTEETQHLKQVMKEVVPKAELNISMFVKYFQHIPDIG
jgi:colanic acid/amylovoran biosynthesis protein